MEPVGGLAFENGSEGFWLLLSRDASSCDIVLDDKAVSRMHAAIVHHHDGRCFVIDLKSVSFEKV